MPCKIAKPFDWQVVPDSNLVVIVEEFDPAAHTLLLYARDEYFQVAAHARTPLAVAEVEMLSADVGRAVIPVTSPWGPCVICVSAKDRSDVAASGVVLGAGKFTTWVPQPPGPAAEGGQYPLAILSSLISHTPGDVHPPLTMVAGVQALCDLVPAAAQTVVGAVQLSNATPYDGLVSLARSFSLGTDDPAFSAMLAQPQWTSNVPYVIRFRSADAAMPSGFVLTDDGMWSDSTLTAFFNDPELRQHPRLFRAHGREGYLGDPIDEQEVLAMNGLDRFPGIPMLLSNVGYRNHAHWVMNSMLPAYYCREMIAAGRICVLVPEYTDYIFASLLAVGVPRSAILVAPPGFYRFTDLLFPSTLSTHVNRAVPPEAVDMFDAVKASCRGRGLAPGPKLVYLTRQGSNAQRKISNEAALVTALQQRGFVCIAPHELTFAEEIACLSDAEVVVGQLGAAMINIAFAPPTAWVVELASHNYISADYWVLATTLGQRFVRILARAPTEDALTLTDFSFEVPLDATLASIDQVCEAARTARG